MSQAGPLVGGTQRPVGHGSLAADRVAELLLGFGPIRVVDTGDVGVGVGERSAADTDTDRRRDLVRAVALLRVRRRRRGTVRRLG